MRRVYHKDDYKNMAVDLLCITSQIKVLASIFACGDVSDVPTLVRAAAILTKVGIDIDPEPIIVEDSEFKEAVYSKS